MIRLMDLLSSDDGACCWGVGFVAMDVVDVKGDRVAAVGGSCGNVMAILAWLGWTARPIARLGADAAGEFIREGLRQLGVDMAFLTKERTVRSPIVLQRFNTARDGKRTHRFSLTCPECGRWLPRYRPVTLAQSMPLVSGDDTPNAFYFDRVSPASLQLAEVAKSRGALVVFEPSSAEPGLKFQRAVDVCHVLKYSQERMGHLPNISYATSPSLVVETHGERGLRYRWKGQWSQLDAVPVGDIVDAAGCGDWCTAMLIHRMGRTGAEAFIHSADIAIEAALKDGQAAAAVNCSFHGARGAMQALSLGELNERLSMLGHDTTKKHFSTFVDCPKSFGMPIHYCYQCDSHVRQGNRTANKLE